jgi:hypothetical protein
MRVYAHIGKGAVVMLNSEEIELMQEVMCSLALEYDWPDVFPKEKPIITLSQADLYSGLYLTKSGLLCAEPIHAIANPEPCATKAMSAYCNTIPTRRFLENHL